MNEANNPLTPKQTLNLHNYFVPQLAGLDGRESNQLLMRGALPFKAFGTPQIFRFTLPVATAPLFPDGTVTGLGELTLIDLFMFPGKDVSFGIGPLLVFPTGTHSATGTGKWQAGFNGVAIAPMSWGLLGGLVTYQHSFAGDTTRPAVSLFTVQPIVTVNLEQGFYLRSSATWTFEFVRGTNYIPLGLGVGKVWLLGDGVTMNTLIEPQYSVIRTGTGVPIWQIFAGVNFQFPL